MIGHKSPRLNLSHKHCGLGTILWFLLVPLLVFASAETGRAQNLLKTIADVPLPGGTTRFDYQSLDPSTGYLYLSHMGDGTVVVFDTKIDKVLANVPGFPVVTCVLVVPALKSEFVRFASFVRMRSRGGPGGRGGRMMVIGRTSPSGVSMIGRAVSDPPPSSWLSLQARSKSRLWQ